MNEVTGDGPVRFPMLYNFIKKPSALLNMIKILLFFAEIGNRHEKLQILESMVPSCGQS